ncbi:hypothetical protein [Halobacterium salinarum]|uniref:hypothetical protein n=1 Tax=Halobacterium salinarum TaxID=2242 RepID=UPI001F42B394|nr:hypothetical protein [Halobacterium salinarum]MCF2165972.1 hypothetical protein [Halobacterium salinarum]MCF2167491.1 hypothetical protein [Halobacterium salinarum]
MRPRIVLIAALVVSSMALAGCSGTQSGTPTASTASTTSPTVTSATTTTEDTTSTSKEPQQGDNLLSISKVGESTAKQVNESNREIFSELNESQQRVFLKSYNCSCNVEQDVFEFHDKGRTKYVKYNEEWYYLRVAIV